MQFFEKPLDQITKEDIGWLVDNEVREGQTFELKGALSSEKGNVEPWTSGENKIGRSAVTALVRELVSFTNSQGGTLVLGVAEGGERPARATAITPVRAAVELAERLKRTCPDNFDPPVYGFEIAGIATDEDGSGVVVMRIPASIYGPHRSRADKECYVRRNDEAMSIGMDEIHRRVIEMSRRLEVLDQRFASFSVRPEELSGGTKPSCLLRIVALPTGPFFLPKINKVSSIRYEGRNIPSDLPHVYGVLLAPSFDWRPIVQGVEGKYSRQNHAMVVKILSDGSIRFDWRFSDFDDRKFLHIAWIVGAFGNVLLAIERLRRAAGLIAVEYNAEVQLGISGVFDNGGFILGDYTLRSRMLSDIGGIFEPGIHRLARYPINGRENFGTVTQAVERDAYHLAGADPSKEHHFDYSLLLAEVDRELG